MCGAATNPDAHVFAYAAAQVKKALEVTQELGGRELRLLGRARGLRDAPQHRPQARAGAPGRVHAHGGRLRQGHRLQGPVPHRAQAQGADQAPVRLRRRRRHRLPEDPRPRPAFQVQHRDQPRHPGRPHLPARDRDRGGARPARLDRRQHRRPAARLGHRPVQHRRQGTHPRHGLDPARRRAGLAAASISTPSCAGPPSISRTCSTRTSAGSTPTRWPSSSRAAFSPRASSPSSSPPATTATMPASAATSSRGGWASRSSRRSRSSWANPPRTAGARNTSRTCSTSTSTAEPGRPGRAQPGPGFPGGRPGPIRNRRSAPGSSSC